MSSAIQEKADLARLMRPCPTCGGKGEIRGKTRNGSRFVDRCYECGGAKVIPAETPEEYAARLRALVEQARKERDWCFDALTHEDQNCPIHDPDVKCQDDCRVCIADYAARAVAEAELKGVDHA